MSQRLYNSLVEKWKNFLWVETSSMGRIPAGSLMTEEEVDDLYNDLVRDFCKKYRYSERTKELAFYSKWYDTFKDEFYQTLEKEGVKIIHENPMEGDWDYGKKFRFNPKGYWEEVKNET